jgi:hypothetical protein
MDHITRITNEPSNYRTAAHTPTVLPSSRENRITLRDRSIRGKPLSTPQALISILRRLRPDMASFHSDTMTSQISLINVGKREAVQTDRRKKIGSTPRKT